MFIRTSQEIKGRNQETFEETTYILPGTKCEVMMILGDSSNKYYLCKSSFHDNVFVPIFKNQCEIIKAKKGNDILSEQEEINLDEHDNED